MSLFNIPKSYFENTTVTLKPSTHYISSSLEGVTGSEFISPVRSKCIKDINTTSPNGPPEGTPITFGNTVAINRANSGQNSIKSALEGLFSDIKNHGKQDIRFTKNLNIGRLDIPVKYDQIVNVKKSIKNILIPHYKVHYNDLGLDYGNYHTLNFFTNTVTQSNEHGVPADSALLYPNKSDQYTPQDAFTIDFWINPRYDNESVNRHYNPGTIFHMSSSICLSLHSGSNIDRNHLVDDFKLLVQLSQSADIKPNAFNLNNLPTLPNLIFTSSANFKKNHWHHVTVQWGPNENNGKITLIVDENKNMFDLGNNPETGNAYSRVTTNENNVLSIGNFLNMTGSEHLFNENIETYHGLTKLSTEVADPAGFSSKNQLANPLNAELHDIKLFNTVLSEKELASIKNVGINDNVKNRIGNKTYDDLLFYLPPYFYPTTRTREVITTPFQTVTSTTNDPFNAAFSFGVGGKLINLENFTRDFAKGEYPRLMALTASTIATTIQNLKVDEYSYNTGSIAKRNLTILPNDNGLFRPNYYPILISPYSESISYKNINSFTDPSKVSLENLIPSSSIFQGFLFQNGPIFNQIVSSLPENPGVGSGSALTVAQRTREFDSNEITIFNISNIFYGNKIHPKSFHLIDENLTGSGGKISINVKDNGNGTLYRADCLTENATWNKVGDIIYEEGLATINSPHLFYFCKDKTNMKFKGEQNIHVATFNLFCGKDMFFSSSNMSYVKNPPNLNDNSKDLKSIYISAVNIHDDNFNIIMKGHFAQPILKTQEDEFVIRLKQDF